MAKDPITRYRALAVTAIIATGVIFISFWFRSTTVVLVIRHAEKDTAVCDPTPGNVQLSAAGQTRAQALAHVAGATGITAIYASEYCRTQQTVAPLATQLGVTTTTIAQHAAGGTANVDDLIGQLLSGAHRRMLVAGHTDTVPLMIERLGGGSIPAIGENEYDNLYVLTISRWWWNRWPWWPILPASRTVLVRLKYGAPSS